VHFHNICGSIHIHYELESFLQRSLLLFYRYLVDFFKHTVMTKCSLKRSKQIPFVLS